MIVDVCAAEGHFLEHMAPVYRALEPHERGTVYVANERVAAVARRLGLDHVIHRGVPATSKNVRLVASWGDYRLVRQQGRPIVLMEHGAGFTFGNEHESYAGGRGRDNVSLFLCPNTQSANANLARYPHIPAEIVGCPKLDDVTVRGPRGRCVAISFHWSSMACPETNWAFPEYRNHLRDLSKAADCEVIGHSHPRQWPRMKTNYERLGIEPVGSFDEVLERADLYVHDSGSTLYELAAAGRPVIALNSEYYRRDVSHGLRFWDYVPGPQVDRGKDLAPAVRNMLDGGWRMWEDVRRESVLAAFEPNGVDGKASARSAEAIRSTVDPRT